jgi:hypothetical protein
MRFPTASSMEFHDSRARLSDTIATFRCSRTSVQSKSRPASNGVPSVCSNPGEIHMILREGGSSLLAYGLPSETTVKPPAGCIGSDPV